MWHSPTAKSLCQYTTLAIKGYSLLLQNHMQWVCLRAENSANQKWSLTITNDCYFITRTVASLIYNNNVFLKCKTLSLETILSAYTQAPPPPSIHTHTEAHTQAFWLYKAKYTQLKTGSKYPGDLEWIKTHGTENMAGLQFWEKKCF